ncbi:Subtilisin-like protease SBT3.9 [Sesamum alatum]|uniref:Subtilisin-like protease SBT3.9 n=1 Tax=Sesamum alatum TaxID=300844 RepID=A0AAE2CRN1_9LAMI|nr:Subtilisin-like protease SBT3.9 [Sesamum alatum]
MGNPVCFLMLFPLIVVANGMAIGDVKESQIYIVYLGDKPQHNHECVADSHDDILASAVGSKEEARKLMVYNYKHSFSGFAAKLTKAQAKKLAEKPGVLRVLPDGRHRVQNTRSWTSLGLSNVGLPNNLLHQAHMGDGVIVGVVDSGIWPDSEAFNDEGLGPVPARWKGVCKSDGLFNASKHCNRKIIGARWYIKGYLHESGVKVAQFKETVEGTPSPIDIGGHGTHVASTVAGSFVNNVSYYGLSMGTFRGGAPRARLAIYKACWDAPKELCSSSDILAAMDDAVRDGVDVISVSLGGSYPHLPEVSPDNALAIGSFHAVAHGIPVISAAGNAGPTTSTIEEVAPWMISVAASTVDRAFPTPITLGNNKTVMGRGLVIGTRVGFTGLVQEELPKRVHAGKPDQAPVSGIKGKVVLSFFKDYFAQYPSAAVQVADSGGLALIVVRPLDDNDMYVYSDSMQHPATKIPIVEVDFEGGNEILEYIEKSSKATVMIGPSSVLVGKPLTPKIAGFSSRGPNPLAPEILKPDIAAPGASILAAVPPSYQTNDNGFAFMSGTSMAAPHLGGIVALLRALHPHWSPAAIKSALVTTAWNEDTHRTPIFAEGSPAKIADPFDYGGGIVNPNGAAYPGLVYDMDKEDYMNYLCSQDYRTADIYNATKETSAYNATAEQLICQNRYISLLDLNFPSIIIPELKTSITVKRRVTNVGPSNSVYRARIKFPVGTTVSVKPDVLVFNSNRRTIDFEVTVDAEQNMNTGFMFGSLTWTDGRHFVRSPISVRTTLYSLH